MDMSPADDWSVEIAIAGRSGSIHYREPSGNIYLDLEFRSGKLLFVIYGLEQAAWEKRYRWAKDRRMQILGRVALEFIRQKAPHCVPEVGSDIYIWEHWK